MRISDAFNQLAPQTVRGRKHLAPALVAALVLATLLFPYIASAALTWQIETVDSDGNVGSYSSLALDNSGRPHISYYDNANQDLKYAHYDGATWQIQTVDSDGNVGLDTSLALDSSGRPHISYCDARDWPWVGYDCQCLKYAWYDGTAWQIETVDSDGYVGRYTSLALDSSGFPHISYFDAYPNNDLKYARYDGSAWPATLTGRAPMSLTAPSSATTGTLAIAARMAAG